MNKKKKEIKDSLMEKTLGIVEQMTGDRNFIGFPRVFVDYMGSIDGAIFLSQLVYWSDRAVRADGGVFKKYDDWKEEIGLSPYEVQRAALVLREKGILVTKLKKANAAPTLHYYLDKIKFSSSINEFLRIRNNHSRNQEKVDIGSPNYSELDTGESVDSLTETTSEITTIEEKQGSNTDSPIEEQAVVSDSAYDYDSYWLRMERLVDQGVSEVAIFLPNDFQPDDNMMFWANTRYPMKMIGRATEKFIDHFKSNRRKSCNWKLKWKEWIENEKTVPRYEWSVEQRDILFYQCIDFGCWLNLFEDFVRSYCKVGLVPYQKFYEGLPHLTKSTIDEALSVCTGQRFDNGKEGVQKHPSLGISGGKYYDLSLYDEDDEYRKVIDDEIAVTEAVADK